MRMRRALVLLVVALIVGAGVAALALGDAGAQSADQRHGRAPPSPTTTTTRRATDKNGVQHLHFEYGPLDIKPGQNIIETAKYRIPQPEEDGWIVGFRPNLQLPDGKVPPVDVLHLHHGVWAVDEPARRHVPDLPRAVHRRG